MARLRIALTLSGAVSLGAYEGGALAALLLGLQEIRRADPDAVVIDAIAGASAGSMTAVLTARALLAGEDPVALMRSAWVRTPSLANLRARGPGAPLSVEVVEADARTLLTGGCPRDPDATGPPPRAQPTPVRLQLALGALRGLDYAFRRLEGPTLEATTYLDWSDITLGPESRDADYLAALTPAMASGAHSAAFPAKGLARRGERPAYEANGVENFPDTGFLWYTDGGTVDNQPLGRALDLTAELDETDGGGDAALGGQRLHLLVLPDPSFAVSSADRAWADPDDQPDWLWTLGHAAKMTAAQSLYADLRAAEKTNSRLRWSQRLVDELAPRLDGQDRAALAGLIAEIEQRRSEDLGAVATPPPSPPDPDGSGDGAELLRRALHAATGLEGKRPIWVDAISPKLIGAEDATALKAKLSGEFLGHFGGFLSLEARQSDFALGYVSALSWMADPERGLSRALPAALVEPALARVRERTPQAPAGAGSFGLGRLGARVRVQLLRVALRAAQLAVANLRSRTGRGG